MPRALLAVVSIALTVYSLADCIQTDASRVRGIPRWGWIVLIVLVPWIGPITWLLVGRERGESGPSAGPRSAAPRRSLGPDDDPEFLRRLDEDVRRRRREQERREREQDESEDPGTGSGPA